METAIGVALIDLYEGPRLPCMRCGPCDHPHDPCFPRYAIVTFHNRIDGAIATAVCRDCVTSLLGIAKGVLNLGATSGGALN